MFCLLFCPSCYSKKLFPFAQSLHHCACKVYIISSSCQTVSRLFISDDRGAWPHAPRTLQHKTTAALTSFFSPPKKKTKSILSSINTDGHYTNYKRCITCTSVQANKTALALHSFACTFYAKHKQAPAQGADFPSCTCTYNGLLLFFRCKSQTNMSWNQFCVN